MKYCRCRQKLCQADFCIKEQELYQKPYNFTVRGKQHDLVGQSEECEATNTSTGVARYLSVNTRGSKVFLAAESKLRYLNFNWESCIAKWIKSQIQ